MLDLMRAKLEAYHDGELLDADRRALEAHLETCPACQADLAALRQLSDVLHSAPLPATLPNAEAFAARLVRRLPLRPTLRPAPQPAYAVWLVPIGLLALMVVLQALNVTGSLVNLVLDAAMQDGTVSWIQAAPRQTVWFGAARMVLESTHSLQALSSLDTANELVLTLQRVLQPLLWYGLAALAYLAWLVAWLPRYLKTVKEGVSYDQH